MITFLIIGSFKKGLEAFDGQTTKVRNYSAEIKKVYKDCKILEIDTFKHSSVLYILCHLIEILSCDVILILPGGNGIKLFLPFAIILKNVNLLNHFSLFRLEPHMVASCNQSKEQ